MMGAKGTALQVVFLFLKVYLSKSGCGTMELRADVDGVGGGRLLVGRLQVLIVLPKCVHT